MPDSQRIENGRALDALLERVKSELQRARFDESAREIDEAMLAGSTGLEIHYLVRGALIHIRAMLLDRPQLTQTIQDAIDLIDRIVRQNA